MAHRWTNTLTHDDVTPHAAYLNRRQILAGATAGIGLAALGGQARAAISDVTGDPVIVGPLIIAGNQSGRLLAIDGRSGAEFRRTLRGLCG